MKKRFLLWLCIYVLLAGCSGLEAETLQAKENIPKSYTLAIGYLNVGKWERATDQLIQTIDTKDIAKNFQVAALLLLIHVTNSELQAYRDLGEDKKYSKLLSERERHYKQLLDVNDSIVNDLFLGLNFNLTKPNADDLTEHEATTGDYILKTWSLIFNESPVDMPFLLEQSGRAIGVENVALGNQLKAKGN